MLLFRKKYDNSMLLKIIIFYSFALIILILVSGKTKDPDTYWHIKAGEYIINNGIPRTDPFSWFGLEQGLKWVNHEWLFGVFIYSIYSIFGIKGVYFFSFTMSLLLYYLIFVWTNKLTGNLSISLFVAMLSMFGSLANLAPRPQIISFCLFIIFCLLMEKKKYYLVILIIILGVNLHGGVYPIYIILGGYYLFKEVSIKKFIGLMSIYLLAILANPYTYDIYLYTIRTFQYDRSFIQEWNPVILIQYPYMLGSIILLIFLTRYGDINFKDIMFITIFSVFSIVYLRNIIFLFIFVFPVASKYFAPSINYYKSKLPLKCTALISKQLKVSERNLVLNTIFSIIVIGLIFTPTVLLNIYNTMSEEDEQYPVAAVKFINNNPSVKNLMSEYGDGGYLIFNNIPTLIDGRADLFTKSFNGVTVLDDYVKTYSLDMKYWDFINKYNVEYVLLKNTSILSKVLVLDYKIKTVYEDNKYTLYKVN